MSLLDLKESNVEFIKYLLAKGADPNKADVGKSASLHYLARLRPDNINFWSM
jgi:hypothetical protein